MRFVLLFLFFASAAALFIGHAVAGRQGLVGGFLAAVVLAVLVFSYSQLRLRKIFESRLLEGQDPWGAREALATIARQLTSGNPLPPLYVFEAEAPAVFSCGIGPWDSGIYLSRPLLDRFSRPELEAVLVHEAVRWERLDTARLTLGASLSFAFFALARLIDLPFAPSRWIDGRRFRPGTALIAPPTFFLTALLAEWPFFSPKRCFDRDRETAERTRSPQIFAETLEKLENYGTTRPLNTPHSAASLFMVNPLTRASWYRYFIGQPTAQRRIEKLAEVFAKEPS